MTDSTQSVLIVSDDPEFRAEVIFAFPQDVKVSLARDAREAWSFMIDEVPAVVCIDIQSGSAGGFGLSRDMDATDRLSHVPRLVLIKRPQDTWLARQSGASAYRVAPVETGELVATILSLTRSPAIS
jgi:DNA-binding response OmpR family regulator